METVAETVRKPSGNRDGASNNPGAGNGHGYVHGCSNGYDDGYDDGDGHGMCHNHHGGTLFSHAERTAEEESHVLRQSQTLTP